MTDSFDMETFRSLIARCDSDKTGEAETSFRKAVLLCTKNGLRFCDGIAAAFGQDEGTASQLEARLQEREEQAAELVDALEEAQQTIAALRQNELEKRVTRAPGFKGWFLHAWRFPQFRLVLMAATDIVGLFAGQTSGAVARLFSLASLCLFVAWSIAQGRKRGFWQLLMKWVVLCSASAGGGMVLLLSRNYPDEPTGSFVAALAVVKTLAVILTLSRFSEFMASLLAQTARRPIAAVKSWF